MEITYRTKNTSLGIGIQVDLKPDTNINELINELNTKGFIHEKSNLPPSFNKGRETHFFNRKGSGTLGFKTETELHDFISDSAPVLIKYDYLFDKKTIYEYDNF